MTIAVLPGSAISRAEPLLAAAGWRGAAAGEEGDDGRAAVSLAQTGRPVLFAPPEMDVARELRRILVVHEGSRGDRAGIDAANDAAVASGAEVTVLHVPSRFPSTTSASLPFRMADHATYDWAEWRDEFLRRFCRCSEGVEVTLRVGTGSTAAIRTQIAAEQPDLVIASSSRAEPGVREAIEALLDGDAPVLLVPSVGHEAAASS